MTVLPEHPLTEELTAPAAIQLKARAQRTRRQDPELALTTEVARGEVLDGLVKHTGPSTLLVVGAGEHRILQHPARWSRCLRLVAQATGPVVAVPASTKQPGQGVLVGADGSEEGRALVEYAAHLATGFKADLRIVHAWLPPMMVLNPYPLDTATVALVEEPHQRFTTDLVLEVQKLHPEIHVSGTTIKGHPATALVTADPLPELVVVGRRARSRLQRTILGSTSRDVIVNLNAPTLVLPLGRPAPPVTPRR